MTTVQERVQQMLDDLQAADDRRTYRRKDFFEPYAKQIEFCDMGSEKRERLLSAGNQTGKTEIGAYEAACHLTGEYPDWWLGKRWDRPVKCWVSGETGLSVRDIVQKKLCGEPGVESAFGTGMIPKEAFIGKPSSARGIQDLYDTAAIRHKTGGISIMKFKSYEQGREKWQGDTLDFVWYDEEPPQQIYAEGLARLAEGGMSYLTFTPLLGMTEVVKSFFRDIRPDQGKVMMDISDVTHFSEEEKAKRIAAYPEYQREARSKGIPVAGIGKVFQISEEFISEEMIDRLPHEWPMLWGIDFGIRHPFAGVLVAWDRESDIIHVIHCFRMKNAMPVQHMMAMKPFGRIRVAWPHDGDKRDFGNLSPLAKQYKDTGLWMADKHATFPDGSNSTEAGIMEMDERFKTGRLKVARHLTDWFEEYRLYHRDENGLLVKKDDDLMSATRIAIMAKRLAAIRQPWPGKRGQGSNIGMADGVEFDVFG